MLIPVLALAAHFDAERTRRQGRLRILSISLTVSARGVTVGCGGFAFTLWNSEAARKITLSHGRLAVCESLRRYSARFFILRLLRAAPTTPASPVESSTSVAGSGTGSVN